MWNDITCAHYALVRSALPDNLPDGKWAVLEPIFLLPLRVARENGLYGG